MQSPYQTGTEDFAAVLEDGVLTLTMNRPDRRNALSRDMLAAMAACLAQAEIDPDVRVIILTGAGKAFCAGGDVKMMAAAEGEPVDVDYKIHKQRISQLATAGKLYEMPKPTIAALPGAAAGAGFSLALSCDLRIASEEAFLTTAFARVGFSGDYGGTFFLTRLIGAAKARELYLLSDRVSASEALGLGLVNKVVAADDLQTEAMALARRLADGPPIAYRYMKENLNRAVSGEMTECLDMEVTHHAHTGLTDDHKNAARAFVEKRTPVFKGR